MSTNIQNERKLHRAKVIGEADEGEAFVFADICELKIKFYMESDLITWVRPASVRRSTGWDSCDDAAKI